MRVGVGVIRGALASTYRLAAVFVRLIIEPEISCLNIAICTLLLDNPIQGYHMNGDHHY